MSLHEGIKAACALAAPAIAPMAPEELKACRERAEAATPGPWRVGSVETYHVFVPCSTCMGPERVLLRFNEHFPHAADAEFIAHAREDVPSLLATVAHAEARAERAEAALASLRHAALFAAGVRGGPHAWRWAYDLEGTFLDDDAAWERLLEELRQRAWYEQNCPEEPAEPEPKGPAWAMGFTDETGTVVVECCERSFESRGDAADYLADDAPMGLWYWEGTIRAWQCPEGDYDSEAIGKFTPTTARCVNLGEAPGDEEPSATAPPGGGR